MNPKKANGTSYRPAILVFIALLLGFSIGKYYNWTQDNQPWILGANWKLELPSARRIFAVQNKQGTTTLSPTSTLAPNSTTITTTESLDDVIQREQEKRQQILQRVCERERLPLYKKHWMVFKKYDYTIHVIVDDHHKILFNYVPKVSCTTWKKIFMGLRSLHSNGGYFPRLKDYNDTEIKERLNTYKKVLFVREPITRLLSAYLSKFQSPNHLKTQKIWETYYGREIIAKYRPYANYHINSTEWLNIQLDEIIQFITDMGSEINMDEFRDHFLPIHRVANPCVIKYDFIGHFENLEIEGPYVLRWLGVDNIVRFPPVHASRASQSLIQAYQTVPLNSLRRLWKYYELDYEMFGYSINDTITSLVQGVFDEEAESDLPQGQMDVGPVPRIQEGPRLGRPGE
ncbi:carbohydrate sulfotransferase 11-like [Amphiura filiformis]|uniref:carbohydrate sulfotransferase 11-like n=1 Tax=Amphiura filiformis TaxID=82378 RepID=UPI003B21D53E